MLLVASETGHVYTFATRKLQPMITSESGKALIQTCLNSPDAPPAAAANNLDQRMNPTGFEEPELSYGISEDEQAVKVRQNCKASLMLTGPFTPSESENDQRKNYKHQGTFSLCSRFRVVCMGLNEKGPLATGRVIGIEKKISHENCMKKKKTLDPAGG